MGAKYSRQLKLTGPAEEFLEITKTAMLRLGWDLKTETHTFVKARATMSMMSWGEDVVVRVYPNGKINLSSEFIFPVFFDLLGRNRDNINKLVLELKDIQQNG